MHALKIVPMTSLHLDGCAAIVDSAPLFQRYSYTGEMARAQLAAALSDPRSHLLVHRGGGGDPGRINGFAWYVERGAFDHSGYLRLIAVAEDARRRGIGAALVELIETQYVGRGGLVLLVSRGNVEAQRFYERLGYQRVGELPSYVADGLDELIYFKNKN
jgi:ribosomal protein S18 acetylase RimI-like enzyme